MRKIISLLMVVILVVSLIGCGNEAPDTDSSEAITSTQTEKTTISETNDAGRNAQESTDSPPPSPMDANKGEAHSVYGARTGTDKTYTGLEPLPEITLSVIDPENLRGLSTSGVNHSYGVSKGGEPHHISVDNQKIYEKYGGICLDTSGKKCIYLTFDCGYENGYTEIILDALKEKNVTAAFFITMDYAKTAPEIVARMINEGHIVGNHSTTHANFSNISRLEMAEEIETLDNYLRVKFGYSSNFFRFPEGTYSESALDLVQNCGYKSVFWSSAYADWDANAIKGAQYALDTVTSRLHPGCVLLLHAVSPDNANAMADIIDKAKSQGYEFKALY